MKRELTLSPELATTIAKLRQRVQDTWDNLLKDAIGAVMTVCMREYMLALLPEGVHCMLMWLFGHPLLWHMCFIWSEFVIICSYSDKLSITSIFNTMNLSFKVLNFFLVVYTQYICILADVPFEFEFEWSEECHTPPSLAIWGLLHPLSANTFGCSKVVVFKV